MGRPSTRGSTTRRGRSSTPERKPSPAKTRSRTRSTKKPKAELKAIEKKTEAKKSPKTPVKATPAKTKVAAKKKAEAAASGFAMDTVTVLRIHYVQLFITGVMCLLFAEEFTKLIYLKNQTVGVTYGMRWSGVFVLAYSMQLMAAAQGNKDSQKKALQYGMFYWLMAAGMIIATAEHHSKREVVVGYVVYDIVNISLAIWACYFHEQTAK